MYTLIGIILLVAIIIFTMIASLGDHDSWKNRYTFISLACAALLIVTIVLGVTTTASGQRFMKDMQSENTGGLQRNVAVYDQNGHLLREYQGKVDVEDTEYGNKVKFDLDGKRTIIYNATVIVQEK